jgi:predicted amidohydrolase
MSSTPGGPLIGVQQYGPHYRNKAANLQLSIAKTREAAEAGAKIIVLPECCLSGIAFNDKTELADLAEPSDGTAIHAWSETARSLNIYLVAGFAERLGASLFNSAIVLTPDGRSLIYRKCHLFGNERALFDLGERLVCIETPWGKLGVAICYDLWFPEFARALALAGATLIAAPANWFTPLRQAQDEPGLTPMGVHHAMSAACSNEVTIACADRIGEENGTMFLGCSCIVGPTGRPLAGPAANNRSSCLLAPWISSDEVRQLDQSHLHTRRDNLYSKPVFLREADYR